MDTSGALFLFILVSVSSTSLGQIRVRSDHYDRYNAYPIGKVLESALVRYPSRQVYADGILGRQVTSDLLRSTVPSYSFSNYLYGGLAGRSAVIDNGQFGRPYPYWPLDSYSGLRSLVPSFYNYNYRDYNSRRPYLPQWQYQHRTTQILPIVIAPIVETTDVEVSAGSEMIDENLGNNGLSNENLLDVNLASDVLAEVELLNGGNPSNSLLDVDVGGALNAQVDLFNRGYPSIPLIDVDVHDALNAEVDLFNRGYPSLSLLDVNVGDTLNAQVDLFK